MPPGHLHNQNKVRTKFLRSPRKFTLIALFELFLGCWSFSTGTTYGRNRL